MPKIPRTAFAATACIIVACVAAAELAAAYPSHSAAEYAIGAELPAQDESHHVPEGDYSGPPITAESAVVSSATLTARAQVIGRYGPRAAILWRT